MNDIKLSASSQTTVIVGAGIVGAAIAFDLMRRGHKVTIVDKDEPGMGASFGNMASIAVTQFMAVSRPSTWKKIPAWMLDPEGPVWLRPSYAPKMAGWFLRFIAAGRPSRVQEIEMAGASLCKRVHADLVPMLAALGASDMLTEEGCLSIYETQAEYDADREALDLMDNYGFGNSLLRGEEIRALEPSISPHVPLAVLMPQNQSIRNPFQLVTRLMDAVRSGGGEVVRGEAVDIEDGADGPVVILKDGRRLMASSVVLAAGVLTRNLARVAGEPIPLETERGYHTQIMEPAISMRHSIIWPRRAFMITPTAGGIRIGGNVELAGLDAVPDFRRARVLVRHAQRVLPGLATKDSSEWMGHRPALPDTIPVISRSVRRKGLYYATGHGHLGLTYAATTGRLIGDMISGITPPVDMKPFSITRF